MSHRASSYLRERDPSIRQFASPLENKLRRLHYLFGIAIRIHNVLPCEWLDLHLAVDTRNRPVRQNLLIMATWVEADTM